MNRTPARVPLNLVDRPRFPSVPALNARPYISVGCFAAADQLLACATVSTTRALAALADPADWNAPGQPPCRYMIYSISFITQ
jgi:hypothetical protein